MMNHYNLSLTNEAIDYAWRQLLSSTGLDAENLPIEMAYGDNEEVDKPGVIVKPCADNAWKKLLERKPNRLNWLSVLETVPSGTSVPFPDLIPVLFWGAGYEDGHKPFAERREDGSVIFYADIIAATLFMLTRWEETIVLDRDEYGRFPATASVAYKQGFLDRPIVDEYALILREWLKTLLPNWVPNPRSFSIKLTHDIDSIRNFVNLPLAMRTLAGDLLKRRDWGLAGQTLRDTVQQLIRPREMEHFKGIAELSQISRSAGVDAVAFYVMTANPAVLQNDYDYRSPLLRAALDDLRTQGFEIGLHAGYTTLDNPEQLAEEKARLQTLLGEPVLGGRQHYLRFKVPDTWRHWESVGLTYDATLGYAGHEGFRCGTCHPFRPFDLERNCELALWEYPLIVMDSTLKQYRKLTPKQGEQRILELARRCQAVEGTFILLWHNSSLHRDWQPWGEMYTRVVQELAQW